ncbi:hypothetical protein SAMD00019534_042380, partial [Acytostelium subglobosum LB1]|uniref:hypothetical protein n=1 Tax=Acytostelium subglobosum LB1 TaxID=1410327 RepID=UPI00064522A6
MMKAVQYANKGEDLKLVEVPIPKPGKDQVRIKIVACGICHSDTFGKYGIPGITYPRTPGHEVGGVIDQLGEGVTGFKVGDKVGVGWFGGHCGHCKACREDDWVCCTEGKVCGIHYDGGFAEYMVAPLDALARIPDNLPFEQAGPLMCAGITVFNSIRHQHIKVGSVVCILGIGGLGHLAIQFARRMGYEVVAHSSGADKEKLARDLGAHHYIDGSQPDAIQKLTAFSPKMIVATTPHAKTIESVIPTLAVGGKLLVLAAAQEPLSVSCLQLIGKKQSIGGWPSGDSRDSEETMRFAQINDVTPMIETFPLEKAPEALAKALNNKVRFRSVLVMKH